MLGDVRQRFVTISQSQKIAYVVDARHGEENKVEMVALA